MLKNLLLLLTIFTCTSLSAQTWDGGGDGTSWDDATNWSTDTIPEVGATAIFPDGISANVTGSAPNAIRRIIFDTLSTVTLDLDLDFEITGNPVHAINLQKDANVTFGGTSDMRTFNIVPGIGRNAFNLIGEGITVTVTEQASLSISNICQNAIRINKADGLFVNNGTINLVDYVEHGINLLKGTFTNNGTIDIGAGTVDGDPTSDGIRIANDGVFDNNANGVITITQALDDGLEVLGVFSNAGTISTVAHDDGLANNGGLVVGSANSAGVMNNLAGGTINADGGIGGTSRAFSIQGSGTLNNAGAINISGGNMGQALQNLGTLTNEICARINLTESRVLNSNAGMLTNNGLITSSWTGSGVNNAAADGSVLNNAFYGYTNTNADFAGGNEESTDNGQNSSDGIVVDAANTCTVADIGIDVPYTWYTDASGTVEAGTNDANGLLNFNDDIFAESGTQTLYTCFGEEVQLIVQNVSGDCALINTGVDFIPLTDVFTMMPNPAQAYTQIEFGHEYIAEDKTIEVYDVVGQLVHTATLSGVDNYILHIDNFTPGIYTVNLQTEKGMQIERLIVQE